MVQFKLGTKRLVLRFVIRKRIGEEVKYFGFYSWEEEFQSVSLAWSDGWCHKDKFVATRFIPREEYEKINEQTRVAAR